MLNEKVSALLNDQINKELYSAYLYLDISNYYYAKSLNGFGSWFKIQAMEERDHAMLILTYLQNNGVHVQFSAIDAPGKELEGLKGPLEVTFEHEQYVTSLIHAIYAAASEIHDYRTVQFLDWFVKEQGEEEKNTDELIKRFEMFGDDARSLYMLDAEMATRVYSAPSLVL